MAAKKLQVIYSMYINFIQFLSSKMLLCKFKSFLLMFKITKGCHRDFNLLSIIILVIHHLFFNKSGSHLVCFHPEGNDRFIVWHMSNESKKIKSSILKRYLKKLTKWTINKVELLEENEIMDDIWFEDVENNCAWFMCLKKWKYIHIHIWIFW
jgi:uncharacterized protein (UPF0333 family)